MVVKILKWCNWVLTWLRYGCQRSDFKQVLSAVGNIHHISWTFVRCCSIVAIPVHELNSQFKSGCSLWVLITTSLYILQIAMFTFTFQQTFWKTLLQTHLVRKLPTRRWWELCRVFQWWRRISKAANSGNTRRRASVLLQHCRTTDHKGSVCPTGALPNHWPQSK